MLASVGLRTVQSWAGSVSFPVNVSGALLDVRVWLGSLGFCIAATVLFGLKPALRLSRRDVVTDLKESGRDALGSSQRKAWAPGGLSVVIQTALSFVLVMGAALFARSAFKAFHANSHFDFEGKLVMQVDLLTLDIDGQRVRQMFQTIRAQFLSLPGVESVAFSVSSHFVGSGWDCGPVSEYAPSSVQDATRVKLTQATQQFNVGVDYFKTLGLPLLQGRAFNELDGQSDAEKVVLVNETLARKIRPEDNPLGTYLRWGPDEHYQDVRPHRVVGIVADLVSGTADRAEPTLYVVCHEKSVPRYIHVRTSDRTRSGQKALLRTLSQEIFRIDGQIPVTSVMTLLDRSRQTQAVMLAGLGARLAAVFGSMTLFLAALGIYAIKGYMVASRTGEIGIRMALGASRRDVMLLVFRQGSVSTLVGLVLGLGAGLGLAHLLRSLFVNISPLDPISIGVTVVILALTSTLACAIPARRAVGIDPMEALRYE
jgi:predicted permease